MKKLLVLFLLSIATSCSNTEYEIFATLYGSVVDSTTGEPIANVNVTLSPGGETRITGTDGYFEFQDLTPQQYSLVAQKTGYSTNRKSINAISGEKTEVIIVLTKHK